MLFQCPRRFTTWLISPFCSSIGTGPPQVSLLLFPVCFPQAFFPFLASSFLHSRSPHPLPRLVTISGSFPFFRVPLQHGFLVRFVFSPRRVRFRFPQLPPLLNSPSLRLVISTSVLLPSPRPQTIRLFPVHLSDPGSTSPTLRIRLLWPAGLPKRPHTTPPERQSQQGKRRLINLSFSITFTVEIRVCKC